MISKTVISIVIAVSGIAGFSGSVQAMTEIKNFNHRPVSAIAAELGVTPDQFAARFTAVSPAGPGQQPTGALERSNKALLLPCLQQANAAMTNELLDSVMDKYRGIRVEMPDQTVSF